MTEDVHARYDYAWKQPGFTVQNPTINYDQSLNGYWNPGLPDDVSKVRVFGKFLDLMTGRTLAGHLTVRASTTLTYTPTGAQVMPSVEKLRFIKGYFSLYLPATDDLQLIPNGWKYYFRLRVQETTQEFEASLPSSPADVDIRTLIPVS
jgi:hypothetical protein